MSWSMLQWHTNHSSNFGVHCAFTNRSVGAYLVQTQLWHSKAQCMLNCWSQLAIFQVNAYQSVRTYRYLLSSNGPMWVCWYVSALERLDSNNGILSSTQLCICVCTCVYSEISIRFCDMPTAWTVSAGISPRWLCAEIRKSWFELGPFTKNLVNSTKL